MPGIRYAAATRPSLQTPRIGRELGFEVAYDATGYPQSEASGSQGRKSAAYRTTVPQDYRSS
jgi:hypothetical protein